MVRIVLDPDEVNQGDVVTLTDGTTVDLADADHAMLTRIAEQLRVHRSSYAHALVDAVVGDQVASGELRVEDHSPLFDSVARRLEDVRPRSARQATDVDPSMLLQTRTWTSTSGSTRLLVELTPSHRRNLIGWLERNSDLLHAKAAATWSNEQLAAIEPGHPWVAGTPLYLRLKDLVAAETGREIARDRAREIARRLAFERTGTWPEA